MKKFSEQKSRDKKVSINKAEIYHLMMMTNGEPFYYLMILNEPIIQFNLPAQIKVLLFHIGHGKGVLIKILMF